MNKQELDAIRERCEKATPGPWKWDRLNFILSEEGMMVAEVRGWGHLTSIKKLPENEAFRQQENNGLLIAHARTDIPLLLAEIDRLTADRAVLKNELRKQGCLTCCGCETEPVGWNIKDCHAWVWRGLEGRG